MPISGFCFSCLCSLLVSKHVKNNVLTYFLCVHNSVPPVFRQKIQNLEVNVGSPAKFECEIEEAPGVTFKWFKSGTELRHSDKCRIISRHHTSSLEIFSPAVADSGEYNCKASNRHGSDSCSAKLTVTGKKKYTFLIGCWTS